jgi:hypothetical protein
MPGNKKFDALMKTFAKEKIAVIHAPMSGEKGGPRTVAMVEVDKTLSDRDKMEEVTPMFGGPFCRSTSVGDMVLVGTKKYEFVGKEELVWKEV